MIRLAVEIDSVSSGGNEFGVGVRVTGSVNPSSVPPGEGATMVGVCMAINDYMRSRGAASFNCLRGLIDDV